MAVVRLTLNSSRTQRAILVEYDRLKLWRRHGSQIMTVFYVRLLCLLLKSLTEFLSGVRNITAELIDLAGMPGGAQYLRCDTQLTAEWSFRVRLDH